METYSFRYKESSCYNLSPTPYRIIVLFLLAWTAIVVCSHSPSTVGLAHWHGLKYSLNFVISILIICFISSAYFQLLSLEMWWALNKITSTGKKNRYIIVIALHAAPKQSLRFENHECLIFLQGTSKVYFSTCMKKVFCKGQFCAISSFF